MSLSNVTGTERVGCLITTDGTDDNLIKPEGLPNYSVPPWLPLEPTDQILASKKTPSTVHEVNNGRLEISELNDETELHVD